MYTLGDRHAIVGFCVGFFETYNFLAYFLKVEPVKVMKVYENIFCQKIVQPFCKKSLQIIYINKRFSMKVYLYLQVHITFLLFL